MKQTCRGCANLHDFVFDTEFRPFKRQDLNGRNRPRVIVDQFSERRDELP